MPDYEFEDKRVIVTIYGKILNERYTKLLASNSDISLIDVIYLDRVVKSQAIADENIKELRSKGLIEGKKPNIHISAKVANETDQKSEYIKMRGIDDSFVQKMIVEYLEKFGEAKRVDFEKIVLDKLPEFLDIKQKKDKVKNNLQSLKKAGKINNNGKIWEMSNI